MLKFARLKVKLTPRNLASPILEVFVLILLRVNLFINLFLANVLILYPLKNPENLRFSGIFRGYKMETLARNVLNASVPQCRFETDSLLKRNESEYDCRYATFLEYT